jgi:glutaredoxin|tara:strand:- start:504 stop:776 length:273 start_codon:yes stop_codon:yes gene_type:complete
MIIELYLYDKFDKTALDILKLLDKLELQFSVQSFSKDKSLEEISNLTGETVRRLPLVFVDGKNVGRYYDLVELLVKKGFINYEGKPCQTK